MNANLTNMANKTGRIPSKETEIKYINFLHKLKEDIETLNISSLSECTRNKKVSNIWVTFLKLKKIIYKDEFGYYQWNQKVPVSIKLVKSFREFMAIKNANCIKRRKYKELKLEPKKTIEIDFKKVIKVEPKIVSKSIKNTDIKQIGLIRKFLKWIY
jgi:hypothetical protein